MPSPKERKLKQILLPDFQGGLNTLSGALNLGSNEFPAAFNCIPLPGRFMYRGGWSPYANLPATADGTWAFYDSLGAKHFMVWAGGNMYDCVTGTAVLIAAAVYQPGQKIGSCDLNSILYWSSGQPIPTPMQFWNPALGTLGPVISSGAPGSVAPPASSFLFIYTGAIVALSPTFFGPTVYQSNVMTWSAINDPTTWVPGPSSQEVGPKNNGTLVYGRPFGIAEVGVSPFANIVVMRSDVGIFAYSGALGALKEALLNCPVGCTDGASAQYLPTAAGFGTIVWLGNDGQVWGTDGISAKPISDKILPTVVQAYAVEAENNNTKPRFFSGYNQEWQYYWLDIGGIQFVYRWATQSWTLFAGWPTGPSFNSFDDTGRPAYFIASRDALNPALAQIGINNETDDGVMPLVYYTTPVLHGGNYQVFKEFLWGSIATTDDGVTYRVSAASIRRSDNSQLVATPIDFIAPGMTAPNPFVLGVSKLGGPDVLGSASALQQGTPVPMQRRFVVPVTEDEWTPEGTTETLKGNGIQLTIAWQAGPPAFNLLAVEVQYEPMGYLRGAGSLYDPEDLSDQPDDAFSDPTGIN